MAEAIDFQGSNLLLEAPEEATNFNSLHTYCNGVTTVSCWKLSPEELDEVRRTGRVYLAVLGNLHPPVLVGSESVIRFQIADYGVWKRTP